ncbi:MAG: hypothetical protein ACUVV3_10195 [Dehalococcoidia bacterium]
MIRRFAILATVFAVAGALLGVYTPRPTEAVIVNFTLRVHPGAYSTSTHMSCGWHEDRCPLNPGTGHALDWVNLANQWVRWRSYGYTQYATEAVIARGTLIRVTDQACYRVDVQIKDSYGNPRGSIRYVHSDTAGHGYQFDIKGGKNWVSTEFAAAYTLSHDKPGCPGWVGGYWPPHLHHTDSGTGWTRNSYYPQGACPNDDCGIHPITTLGYHQSHRSWALSY